MFNVILEVINKNPIIIKVFLKKVLSLCLNNETNRQVSYFVLDLPLTYYSSEEQGHKKDSVWSYCSNRVAVILTLPIKLVALYI